MSFSSIRKALPKVTSVEETLDLHSPSSTSKLDVRFIKGLKLAVKTDAHSDAKHLKWSYKTPDGNMAVTFDQSRGDWEAKWRREIGKARLEISQHVPGNKWFLVPNPVVKLSTAILGGRDRMYVQWDLLERAGKLGDTLYFDVQGAACKLTATAHSNGVLQYGARVKLNKGILHSATAHYHSTRGVEYALKSRPLDKVKVKAVVKPGTQLHLESSIRPSFVARNLTLTLRYTVPLEEGPKKKDPSGSVSIKWDL